MRILQIDKFLFNRGGSSRVFLETIDGLRSRGQEVAEFAMKDPSNRASAFARYFPPPIPKISSQTPKLARARALWNRFVCREIERRLEALICDFRPDLAHIHNACGQSSASIFRVLHHRQVPTVISVQESLGSCDNLFEKFESFYYRFSGIWRDVRLFICPSEFMARKMAACGFPKEKMRVVRNPHLLPVHFSPLGSRVVDLGKLTNDLPEEELQKVINEARVVVAPMNGYENYSFGILQALGAGRIVVAPRRGGNPEIITDGENGFLFSPDNPASLEAAVQKAMLLTDDEAGIIIARGRQLVLRDHNPDQYFRQLMGVYEEALRH